MSEPLSPPPVIACDPAIARRPGCGALAVVVRQERVLLVRRLNPPDAGLWGFPGGRIEWGETSAEAALRELFEETGVEAQAVASLGALDALDRDADGAVRHHYVLVAVLCRWLCGEGVAADDAQDAAWRTYEEIVADEAAHSPDVAALARRALDAADLLSS